MKKLSAQKKVEVGLLKWGMFSALMLVQQAMHAQQCSINLAVPYVESTYYLTASATNLSTLITQISQTEQFLFSALASVESSSPCDPITILTATTITTSGIYCVGAPIAGTITISVNNVNLNLNGHRVQNIVISSNVKQTAIENGIVDAQGSSIGILANSGSNGIIISNVIIKNAITGIDFISASNATVSNCTLSFNTTGVQLSSSYNIAVQNTIALENTNAGFDLLTSYTNSFLNCQALATGKGNTTIYNNEVVGFSSSYGYGNIFERCIANGTQALSTTDSNSLVAGFVLSGTEGCSKIINSESANAITSSSGVTIPYGILLQGSFNGLSTITGYFALSSGDINTAKWSPDGQYLAVVGNDMTIGLGNDLQILSFNRVSESLTPVAGFFTTAENVNTVSWSPDGQYLAVGGSGLTSGLGEQLQIFQFNRKNNTLQVVAGYFGSSALINWVDWSSDGQYLVVGCLFTYPGMQVFSFNKITNTLTMVVGAINTGDVFTTSWSPDGQYVAVGGSNITDGYGGNTQLQIFQFNRSNNSLTVVAGNLGGISGVVNAISWSPDGQYLAIGGGAFSAGLGAYDFQIFQFNRLNNNLIPLAGAVYDPMNQYSCFSVSWSSDGQYVAIGTDDSSFGMTVYSFNQSTQMLSLVANSSIIASGNWSPDGQYLAIADFTATNNKLQIFTGLQFPSQNVITGNTVYCNGQSVLSQFTGAVGVGISGSSIGNMITGNTAYNNPPVSSNFFVPSNYYFVTNVFNQLFGQAPTELQNISLNGNTPILTPEDIGLIVKQILYESQIIQTQVASLATIESLANLLSPCSSTTISAATTITASGIYQICNTIAGGIAINASDVDLYLNRMSVQQGITIASAQKNITIANGIVQNSSSADGISVGSGCSGISIQNVLISGAQRGLYFNTVADSMVKGCTFTANITGMQLVSSNNVAVSTTVASGNTHAGFDLITSFTNSFFDCNAYATGQNNTLVTNNLVTGFISTNGYGNIFERCIANGTQAFSTTDSSSIVAGFALRGTEAHTKIINSESANAITSASGVTIPYGILLQTSLNSTSSVQVVLSNQSVATVDWSPDGQYFVVGGTNLVDGDGNNNQVQIYQFNRITNTATFLSGAVPSPSQVDLAKWSPDGQYVVVGLLTTSTTTYYLQVYQFNRTNNVMTLVAGAFSGFLFEDLTYADWSPDGQYIAVIVTSATEDILQVFQFNKATNVLTGSASLIGLNGPICLNWSPDGQYIAVGSFSGGALHIYGFNRLTNTLTAGPSTGGTDDIVTIDWSPNGQYLVAAGALYDTGHAMQIYKFNRVTNTIQVGPGALNSSTDYTYETIAANWSPDGQYVAVGGDLASIGRNIQLYKFDQGSNTLTAGPGVFLNSSYVFSWVSWSPDGQYIALAGAYNPTYLPINVGVYIFTGLQFPSQNVISSNTIYCNGQSVSSPFTGAVGVGISGSSIANMIIGNTAYDNPPVSSNFFVPSNYNFVTNVFNQLFGQAPTMLQNISLSGNTPILTPLDPGILLKQDIYLATSAIAQLNSVPTFFSEVALLAQCAPTGISVSTTITAAGTYCLTQSLASGLLINSNNVILNLNGYQITGTLTVSNGNQNVTVRNGFINANGATAGVSVGNGAQSITIRSVFVRNAISGILMQGVNDALIESCSLTQNTTGLLLNGSSAVVCNDVVSYKNSHAGFDLLKSYTNVLNNCQALSTGQGNNALTNNNVIGFSIENGFGNIFENCVANATQALLTTDQASLVAGFALLGTGTQCNKIINCESSNARTGVGGNTIPYGMYLQPNFQGFYIENVSTFTPLNVPNTFDPEGMDWSPDGQYISVAGYDTDSPLNALLIVKYDRVNQVLAIAATASLSTAADTFCSRWHPSGSFVAVGGTANQSTGPPYLELFYFDGLNETLQFLYQATFSGIEVNSMAWSPDGRYLAIVSNASGLEFQLYKFDPIVRVLKLIQTVSNGGNLLYGIWWSPNGNYIGVGGLKTGTIGGSPAGLVVMHFNESGSAVVTVPVPTGFSAVVGTGFDVDDLAWSPDGQYIALAAVSSSGANNVFIYKFSPITGLTFINSIDPSPIVDQNLIEVRWSPDGRYFIVTGMLSTTNQARIYQFNRDTQQLSIVGTLSTGTGISNFGTAWSPDGELLLVGVQGAIFNMYHTYTFPSGNVITNNVVYNNTNGTPGTLGVQGVGISGSSVSNTIIKNDTYNNPFNTIFVANNYNQLFQDSPTYLQNIPVVNTNPTLQQADTILLLKQIEAYSRSLYDHFG